MLLARAYDHAHHFAFLHLSSVRLPLQPRDNVAQAAFSRWSRRAQNHLQLAAPELSATSACFSSSQPWLNLLGHPAMRYLLSCSSTISAPACLAHNIFQLPTLQFRKRTRLFDRPHRPHGLRFFRRAHKISYSALPRAVERMRLLARDFNHDGLCMRSRPLLPPLLAPALHLFTLRGCGLSASVSAIIVSRCG